MNLLEELKVQKQRSIWRLSICGVNVKILHH